MRIGIDARFYGPIGKGLGRYTEKLITELERLSGNDEFYIFLRRENFNEYQPTSKRFHKVLADFPWYGLREQVLWPWLLSRYRLDLMHFPHFNVPLLYRKPFVVTIHDLILFHFPTIKASELSPFLYWLKYWVYRLVIAEAVRRARKIFAVSAFTEHDIKTVYPRAAYKVQAILEAADSYCYWLTREECDAVMYQLGLTVSGETQPFVLSVGNAYPHKNLELLLDMARAFPQYLFVCVGKEDFFYARLKQLAAEERLGNVRFVGFVSDRDLSALYRRARAYFFPSLYEGFGLPVLEAFGYGTPVVAARAGALPEIIGTAGKLFAPHDRESAQEALHVTLTDTTWRERCVADGFKRGAQFSWQRLARMTLQGYHEAIRYERHSTAATRATTP